MKRKVGFGLAIVALLAGPAMGGFPAPRPKVDLSGVALEVLVYDGTRPSRTVAIPADGPFSRELAEVIKGGTWQLSFTSYVPSNLVRAKLDDGRFSINVMGSKVVANQDGAFQKVRELTPAERARLLALLPAK